MNKKSFALIIGLMVVLVSCTTVKETEKVKVGVILSLTGGQAYTGEGTQKGFEIAKKEINNLEMVYEDDQSDAKTAVTAFNKLTDVDGVKIVIGPILSGSVLAIAPLAEQKKVIALSPTATAGKISDAGDYIFRIRETAVTHGNKMAEYAVSKGWKKGAIMNVNAEAGITYANGFKQRFAELGGTIVADEFYEKDAQDMRTQATKIKASSADFVYFPGFAQDIGISMKQLRELGYTGHFLTTPAMEDKAFFTTAGNSGEGAVYSSPLNPERIETLELQEKFSQKYPNQSFSWFIANGYDALKLVSEIVEKCGEETDCIKQQLYATKDYNGASGKFSFDEKGDVNRPLVLMQVKGRKFVVLS